MSDSVPPQVVPESIPLVRDFVFASLTADIIDSDTVLAVDDVSSFPTDAELAKAPLYLTIEAELLHPATFEIVKLTSVDITGLTLTVVRGQFGTTAQGHSAPTLLKGALSADLVRLFRAELARDRVPPPDTDVFAPGDRVYLRSRGAFTFAGGAHFQQIDFNGDNTLGASGSTTLGPSTEVDAGGPTGVTHWAIIQGGFGTPDSADPSRSPTSAIVTATDGTTNQAQALRPFGGTEHQVDFNITLGSDGVDAGIVLGATADGQYGWYLSLTPGASATLYRIESGALTSLGTFGDVLAANATIPGWAVVYDDVLRVWLELSGSPNELTTSSFSIAPGLLRGNNAGLMANSASCATDALLCWNSIGSTMPVGPGVMRGANRDIIFAELISGTPTEEPTTVDPTTFNWGVEPWTPVGSSVWGMFIPSFAVLRFASGDTSGRASITSDLRARDLDVQIVWAQATDPTAVYGMLLRSTADAQNAIYLELLQDAGLVNVAALVGGTRTEVTLASISLPPDDGGGLRHLRVILSGNLLYLYDATDSNNPALLGTTDIPAMYQDFGGTCIGWMMDSTVACSDSTLGIVQLWPSPVDAGVGSGWVAEPTVRVAASPPIGPAPLGSLWLDSTASMFHVNLGSGQWHMLTPRIVTSAPTDVAPDYTLAIDVTGYQLYVSVGGSWHSLTGSGGSFTQRGLVDMGFYGSITDPILRGDFVHQAGGLVRAGWDDGDGQWQSSSTTITQWPSDGSTIYYWLPVQDASIDSSTGVASLTANADSSAGVVVSTQRIAIDGLHISFDADIPDADSGFTIGWFNSATVITDNATPPTYKQWSGTLPLDATYFGVGAETGTFFIFTPTVGVDHQGGTGFFGASPQPGSAFTVGSHHWDIRFSLDSGFKPGDYQAVVYMDGVRLFTTYLYLTSAQYEGGYFFFSAATGSSGTTGAVEVSNFEVVEAQGWTRIRLDALKETRVPLVLLNSWASIGTHVASWSYDQDRIRLHGSISGGAAATQLCEIETDLHPDTGEVYLPVSAQDSGSAWVVRTLHVNYSTIEIVDAQTGDTIYLDNASFPRWQ